MGQTELFHGRVIDPNRVNVDLARRWLDLYESQHGQKCDVPALNPEDASPEPFPDDLLVLDTHQMCLCHMPKGKRYTALSYCWPENMNEDFLATRSKLNDLFQPGSLKRHMEHLSSIIQDAISFMYEVGEQYLWIDALCIIQDDETHRNFQISQMDRIYGAAALTIVCVLPHPPLEAHSGLPGYRSGSRICTQSVEEVKGLNLMTSFIGLDAAARYSRWNERAWTFQEHILSRRKLFFTDLQLYFQCSCAVFCEDSVGEGCLSTAFIYAETSLWNNCGIGAPQHQRGVHDPTWISRSSPPNAIETMESYMSLFDQYSTRDMSWPGDIVSAFQGILSVLKRTSKISFLAGLPEAYLHEALLWLEAGQHTRRTVTKGTSTVVPYPSWSWAGWASTAKYHSIFLGYICPEVDWFIIDDHHGVTVKIDAPGTYDSSVHPKLGSSNKVVTPQEPPFQFRKSLKSREELPISDGPWKDSHCLACWTSIASFDLTGESFDLEGFGGTAWESYENVIIFDRVGDAAGAILLEKRLKADMLKSRRTYEFMLISRSNILADLQFFDADVFEDREWCYINVMLIQRSEDGVASRVGVGVIHEDAWVRAESTTSLVKLR